MNLSPSFQFTQSNLQDFEDCPRRFELRHILRQAWPAIQSEPVIEQEERMRQGELFHRMLQQYGLGIAPDLLANQCSNPILAEWWQNFLSAAPLDNLPADRRVEYTLSAPFAGFRLAAKYDLLAVEPGGRHVILDWKTSLHKPARRRLEARLQTRLYRCLLALAGEALHPGTAVKPEQVEMIYWYAEEPDAPMRFEYDQPGYEEDLRYLQILISAIQALEAGQFLLTGDDKLCKYCIYRSLCERGTRAGDWQEAEETGEGSQGIDLDFEQIGEIAF
jgi:RecB family exonuclease